jgi:hypothetical protein
MDDRTVVRASDACLSSSVGPDTVILHLDSGTYFGLDPVGTRIWELLQEPRAVSEIAGAVSAEYEVEGPRCRRDLDRLLTELLDRGLAVVEAVT